MIRKILVIFGTRPEAIKMAPIILALQSESSLDCKICVTAQHRSMLDEVLEIFDINPHYDLDIMQPNQDLFILSANMLLKLKIVIDDYQPDLILVHGDTSTTLIGSLCAFYSKIKVGHIEAGLRTYNMYLPFPEEMNRMLTTRLSSYHFAPTQLAKNNLLRENVSKDSIVVVGNSVVDALKIMQERIDSSIVLQENISKKIPLPFNLSEKFILVTIHRRESWGSVDMIANALREIAQSRSDIKIVYPMHLNPNIQNPMRKILGGVENIFLINPLNYECFVYLMLRSYLILTDSGGIQEEATIIHKPTLVLRDTTERQEALLCNTLKLIGTQREGIVKEVLKILDDEYEYNKMADPDNPLPYGSGNSAEMIVKFIKDLS